MRNENERDQIFDRIGKAAFYVFAAIGVIVGIVMASDGNLIGGIIETVVLYCFGCGVRYFFTGKRPEPQLRNGDRL